MRHRHHDDVLAVAVSLVALLGCGEPAQEPVGAPATVQAIAVSTADSGGVRMVTITGSAAGLPEWTLSETPLTEISGNAAPFLGSVGEVALLGNQQLVVQDRMSTEVRLFDAEGQVLRLLGSRGDGPGEFRVVTQLSVTSGDTVHAFDSRLSRISSFAPDGALSTTIVVPGEQFAGPGTYARNAWVLDSERILEYGLRLGEDEAIRPTEQARRVVRNGIIQVISHDGTSRASPVELPGEFYVVGDGYIAPSPFSNHPFAAVDANRILYGSGRTYELEVRDFDLRPLMVVRWPGWEAAATDSVVDAVRASMMAGLEEERPRIGDAVVALYRKTIDDLSTPPALPDTLPALASALLDGDGRIWVARFRPPDDFLLAITGSTEHWHQEDVWHVLDADGEPIARVRMPPETRLLAVRSDRVVVVTRDDLNVESVRVLGIEKGAY